MYPRAGESIIMRTVCPQSNMEMVLSCWREHNFQENMNNTEKLREKHKTNRNTGYPAQDPNANRYISGSGWDFFFVF